MSTLPKFPNDIRQAWIKTLISKGKFKPGVKGSGKSELELVKTLVRKEMPTTRGIWEAFTKERSSLQKSLLATKQYAISYAIAFHLPNVARMLQTYARMTKQWNFSELFKFEKTRVVDFGAGTGAMSIATSQILANAGVKNAQYVLYDSSKAALELAKDMLSQLVDEGSVRTQKSTIESLRYTPKANPDGLEIYLMGYLWNELYKNAPARRKLMGILKKAVSEKTNSLIFAFEPALEDQARDAMSLREFMVSHGYKVLYPCPHSQSCPMLERPADRCYSELMWPKPPEQKFVDSLLGVERNILASSVYVFATPEAFDKISPLSKKESGKVVGRPTRKENRNTFDYLVCSPEQEIVKLPKQKDSKIKKILRGQWY